MNLDSFDLPEGAVLAYEDPTSPIQKPRSSGTGGLEGLEKAQRMSAQLHSLWNNDDDIVMAAQGVYDIAEDSD